MRKFRIEKDSLGEIEVRQDALYGAQTQRATNNFPITNQKVHKLLIQNIAVVKKAAALANMKCNVLDTTIGDYIILACDEVIAGLLDEHFITDIIQGGAGTSFHMNVNEVIANRAAELAGKPVGQYDYIHPNDHVNYGQSTNDVVPTAARITSMILVGKLIEQLNLLQQALISKSQEFGTTIKLGRTHLQDALPIPMQQVFNAYASNIERNMTYIKQSFQHLAIVNIGGTAIGTKVNTKEEFLDYIMEFLKEITHLDLVLSEDLIDATCNVDPFVLASSSLKTLSVSLNKMCNDLRLMASGPKGGLMEITIPEQQAGSSIMPGKVNPVILEVVNQVCFQVMGNDLIVSQAAQAGQFELNVFGPILYHNLFEALEILTQACFTLRVNCLMDLKVNQQHCQKLVDQSLTAATFLSPYLGYETASKIAKEALETNTTIKELVLKYKLMDKQALEEVLNVENIGNYQDIEE